LSSFSSAFHGKGEKGNATKAKTKACHKEHRLDVKEQEYILINKQMKIQHAQWQLIICFLFSFDEVMRNSLNGI